MAKLKSTRVYGDLIVDNELTVGSSDVTAGKIVNWNAAYTHSTQPHAPSNAQKNSNITQAEIEAKLVGEITSHSHALPNSISYTKITVPVGTQDLLTNSPEGSISTIPQSTFLPMGGTAADSSKLGSQLPSYYLDYNNFSNKPTIPTIPSVMTTTEGNAGTATTQRTINAANLKTIVLNHSPAGSRPASDVSTWAKASTKPSYSWSEIGSKPTFATVSTSGSYTDLIDKPTIPTIPSIMTTTEGNAGTATTQRTINAANLKSIILNHSPAGSRPASDVSSWAKAETKPNYNWNEIGSKPTWIGADKPSYVWSEIGSKPSFATVATSGSYTDLTNKPAIPSIPSVMTTTEGNAGTATTQRTINAANLKTIVLNHSPAGSRPASDVKSWAKADNKPSYGWSEIGSKPTFATVSTSGSYNDLSDKPTIPTIPSVMTTTEGNAGTATTQRTINAANLKSIILNHSPAGSRPASDVPDWAKNTTLGTTGNPMVIGTTPESNLITSLTMSQLADAMNITGNLPIIYGYSTTSTSTTAKVVSATGSSNPFTEYIKDQIYVIEFYYGNTATTPTININSAGAKTVRRLTTAGGTSTGPGTYIFYNQNHCMAAFVYDGTYMIPISCFSRYINASETKMLNYSKAGTVSAITTSDSVLSAIGKLEKAVESSSGGDGTGDFVDYIQLKAWQASPPATSLSPYYNTNTKRVYEWNYYDNRWEIGGYEGYIYKWSVSYYKFTTGNGLTLIGASSGGSGGATSIYSGTAIELDASFTIGRYLEAKPYLFELKFMNDVSNIVLTGMLKGGSFWKSTFVTFYDYNPLYLEFEVQGGMGNSSVDIRWRSNPAWNYSEEVSLEIWEI